MLDLWNIHKKFFMTHKAKMMKKESKWVKYKKKEEKVWRKSAEKLPENQSLLKS